MLHVSCMFDQAAVPGIFNSAFSVIGNPGVAEPCSFSVSSKGEIEVSAHSGLFGCGVALSEDSLSQLLPGFIGTNAYQGTILYRLDPNLYVQPVLSIEQGYISGSDDYTLVIGYINYPGSNNQLDSSMLIPVYPNTENRYSKCLLAGDLLTVMQQRVPGILQYASIQDNNGELELWITNTSSETLSFALPVPLLSEQYPATSLDMRLALETGISLYPGIKFRGVEERSLGNGNIFGPVSRSRFRVSLLEVNLKNKEPFIVNLNFIIPAGRTAVLALIGAGNSSFFGNTITAD